MSVKVRTILADDRGATVVEFALVTPLLILILLGCLDMARALNAYVTVANASREGARYASVHPGAAGSAIEGAVRARIAPLDPTTVSVTSWYEDGSGFQPWPTAGIPQTSSRPVPVEIRVDVSYPWKSATSLVGSFFSAVGSRTFSSSSVAEAIR